MITLFQVDKSGRDILDKDYSVVLIVNKREAYGVNISQEIKDAVSHEFNKGHLWKSVKSPKTGRMRLRVRFHTAIVILLIRKAVIDLGSIDDLNIEICNDFDGHFHEIKDMIYMNISKLIPTLKREDIIMTKFQKPSLIDEVAANFRKKDKNPEYTHLKIDLDALIKIIKK